MPCRNYKDQDRCEVINIRQYVLSRKRCSFRTSQRRWIADRSVNVCERHAGWVDEGLEFEVWE
jgi:hypothetical protein